MSEKKPQFYFSINPEPSFSRGLVGFRIYVGRVKEMGNDIVWNFYTPFFNFGYAW